VKLLLAAVCWPLLGQPLAVYSELAQIDKTGSVTAPREPREILSPAIGRNAYSSFQVVVQAPAAKHWHLYVGQNPPNAVKITVYRQKDDALERVDVPYESDGPQVFWMDVWADRTAAVQRIKIEPELYIDDDWVIYPMEARVMDAVVPDAAHPDGFLPPATVMKAFVCSAPAAAFLVSSDVAKMRYRNAQQDVALAGKVSKDELKRVFGSCDANPPADNPEWYLRIRDYLLRLR
jgi:hypothetical protein